MVRRQYNRRNEEKILTLIPLIARKITATILSRQVQNPLSERTKHNRKKFHMHPWCIKTIGRHVFYEEKGV
jgi:hypothetical protein